MRGPSRQPSGFTLIEIMMVVALASLMATSAAVGFSALRRGRLRAGAAHVASAMRRAYVHSLTTGRTTRLALAVGTRAILVWAVLVCAVLVRAMAILSSGMANPSLAETRTVATAPRRYGAARGRVPDSHAGLRRQVRCCRRLRIGPAAVWCPVSAILEDVPCLPAHRRKPPQTDCIRPTCTLTACPSPGAIGPS